MSLNRSLKRYYSTPDFYINDAKLCSMGRTKLNARSFIPKIYLVLSLPGHFTLKQRDVTKDGSYNDESAILLYRINLRQLSRFLTVP